MKSLADAIFEPINKAFKAGGLVLTLLSVGAFLMLVAFFWPNKGVISYLLLSTGLLLIVITCIFFYIKEMRPLLNTQRKIEENRELIDAVQNTAIIVTDLVSDLQALAFKHANQISGLLQEIRPQIRPLPLIGRLADSELVVKSDAMSATIVDYTNKVKRVVADLKHALVTSNPKDLKKYLNELEGLRAKVEHLLIGSPL
jgi:cellulose biosynthesis protein BcsQ